MIKIILPSILLLLLISCAKEDNSPLYVPKAYTIKYEVKGTASKVNLTYENSSSGTSQESNVSLPWTYNFEGYDGRFVYISAQNQGASGSVTVTIYKDDSTFKTSTSSGPYVIATASGNI